MTLCPRSLSKSCLLLPPVFLCCSSPGCQALPTRLREGLGRQEGCLRLFPQEGPGDSRSCPAVSTRYGISKESATPVFLVPRPSAPHQRIGGIPNPSSSLEGRFHVLLGPLQECSLHPRFMFWNFPRLVPQLQTGQGHQSEELCLGSLLAAR